MQHDAPKEAFWQWYGGVDFSAGLDNINRRPHVFRMPHNQFHTRLKDLHDKAVKKFAAGERNPDAYFDKKELTFLSSIGARPMDLYDFAEDFNGDGEPDWETCLLIQTIRRDYFLIEQQGRPDGPPLPEPEFPAKDDELEGIPWLPRLILKTRCKLRGEMPPDLMYCCGGDRNFFRTHNIHPAEFLHLVWRNENDERAIVTWVLERSAAQG